VTLLEIKQELARETNKNASDLDATTSRRFQSAINRHYKRLASLPGLQHLRDGVSTFTSVAGQAEYQVPGLAKVKRIYDASNRRLLEPLSMAQYREIEQDAANQQGLPTHWVWEGYSGATGPRFDLFLYQTPSAAVNYTMDVTRALSLLDADTATPILPADFHDLLFLGALFDEYRHLDDSRAMIVARQVDEREKQFKYWMHESDAGSMSLSGGMAQSSRLGPWFPAGS
jgi:hypothetical protein